MQVLVTVKKARSTKNTTVYEAVSGYLTPTIYIKSADLKNEFKQIPDEIEITLTVEEKE